MNLALHPAARSLGQSCLGLLVAAAATIALAAPGAHGPGGEHLDEKATAAAAGSLPRIEAASDLFELVAQVRRGELVVLIDRFATNEPVLGAKVDVETGSLKAVAAFRADTGDYVVTDAALLKALATPGEHAVVFTLVAGPDADLLDGKLVTAGTSAAADDHGHAHDDGQAHAHGLERAAWIGAGVLALGLLSGVVWWRRQGRNRVTATGAQS